MSFIKTRFFSTSLMHSVDYYAVIPPEGDPFVKKGNPCYDRPMKTVILLHGYTGCSSDWITNSNITELCNRYNIAVLLPEGNNSFYLDRKETGNLYSTFVGKELLEHARGLFHLSDRREDTFIGGYSMGGYGAVYNGLKYADNFSRIVGLSNALIIDQLKGFKQAGVDSPIANLAYYESIFGDLEHTDETEYNPEVLIKKVLISGKEIPQLFLACGTEDSLLEANRKLDGLLKRNEIPHIYRESPGQHDWKFWNHWLNPAFEWMSK